MSKINFVCGSDPELFAVNEEGMCIPPAVVEFMGLNRVGTENKKNPNRHPWYYLNDNIYPLIIADGAAFEFGRMPVGISAQKHYDTVMYGIDKLQELINPFGLKVCTKASVPFNLDYYSKYGIDIYSDEFWMSVHFGCDPQKNIYDFGREDAMLDVKEYLWRHAGGHLHISSPDMDMHKLDWAFIQLCDVILSQINIVNCPEEDVSMNLQRQNFYGKAGNYRYQIYPNNIHGLEYRTMSLTWNLHLDTVKKIFDGVEKIFDIVSDNDKLHYILDVTDLVKRAKDSIKLFDKNMAQSILEEVEKCL